MSVKINALSPEELRTIGDALKMLKGVKGAGKGFMRPLLEIAFEEGRRLALPVVLDTDADLKKAKYEHLGMRCVTATRFLDGVKLYGLVYEPETMPMEWSSEVVLGIKTEVP